MAPRMFRPRMRRPVAAGGGFTLIELMVTVAILAILVAMAVPSLSRFATARATSSQAEELAAAMRVARSDALRLNATVSVCASSNTTSTSPTCSGTTAWVNGWLIFIDYNGDGSLTANVDRLLRVQSPLNAVQTIESSRSAVIFLANGLSTATASLAVKPKLDTGDSTYAAVARTVCVATIGRATLKAGVGGC